MVGCGQNRWPEPLDAQDLAQHFARIGRLLVERFRKVPEINLWEDFGGDILGWGPVWRKRDSEKHGLVEE